MKLYVCFFSKRKSLSTTEKTFSKLSDDKLIQLRTAGTNDTINKIKKIMFNTPNPKEDLKIDDLANIYETYKEGDSFGMTNGNPALTLRVFRSLGTDTLEITKILENTIKEYNKQTDENINIQIYDLSSQLIRDRINLLLKNGLGGLILVLIILFY